MLLNAKAANRLVDSGVDHEVRVLEGEERSCTRMEIGERSTEPCRP
jgi:hypothetical protein